MNIRLSTVLLPQSAQPLSTFSPEQKGLKRLNSPPASLTAQARFNPQPAVEGYGAPRPSPRKVSCFPEGCAVFQRYLRAFPEGCGNFQRNLRARREGKKAGMGGRREERRRECVNVSGNGRLTEKKTEGMREWEQERGFCSQMARKVQKGSKKDGSAPELRMGAGTGGKEMAGRRTGRSGDRKRWRRGTRRRGEEGRGEEGKKTGGEKVGGERDRRERGQKEMEKRGKETGRSGDGRESGNGSRDNSERWGLQVKEKNCNFEA